MKVEEKMLESEMKRISGISRSVGTSFYSLNIFTFSNHEEKKKGG
jgi:hypothetical protein